MAGLDWVFYSDGSNFGYRTSYDNFATFTPIRACAYGFRFDVCFDGTYLHYAVTIGSTLYYRRGTPNSNGSISWSAQEQSVDLGGLGANYPSIDVDSNGYAFVGYYLYISTNAYYPYIIKNAKNDGTWQTDWNYQLSTSTNTSWRVTVRALTSGKVYAIYSYGGSITAPVYGKLWNGSNWGSEELLATNVRDGSYISAIADGDVLHFVWKLYSPYDIVYRRRNPDGSLSAIETVKAGLGTTTMVGTLTLDPATGRLYCFYYMDTTAPTIKYRVRDATGWGDEQTLIADSGGVASGGEEVIHSYLKVEANILKLIYYRNRTSPYNIRLETLSFSIVKTWNQIGYIGHIYSRPTRLMKLVQTLKMDYVFRKHLFMRLIEFLKLTHIYNVTAGIKKTKIFFVMGDSAFKISSEPESKYLLITGNLAFDIREGKILFLIGDLALEI